MEQHPRLDLSKLPLSESKIILGSFPTWTLTEPDPERIDGTYEKELERKRNGDMPFFYGSSSNRFWSWYKIHVDENILLESIISIQNSLKKNRIGITDMIISCERKNKSALDKHLINRTYNYLLISD